MSHGRPRLLPIEPPLRKSCGEPPLPFKKPWNNKTSQSRARLKRQTDYGTNAIYRYFACQKTLSDIFGMTRSTHCDHTRVVLARRLFP